MPAIFRRARPPAEPVAPCGSAPAPARASTSSGRQAMATALLALSALLVSGPSTAAPQDEYAYQAPIAIAPGPVLQRLPLPAEVLSGLTRADQGDLIVVDAGGRTMPHAIRQRGRDGDAADELRHFDVPLFALGTAIDSGRAIDQQIRRDADGRVVALGEIAPNARGPADAWLIDNSQHNGAVQGVTLVLTAAARFAGRMRVEASDDLAIWRTLTTASPLIERDGADDPARLRLTWLPTTARYLRLSWSNPPRGRSADNIVASAQLTAPAHSAVDARDWASLPALETRLEGSTRESIHALPGLAPVDRFRLSSGSDGVLGVELAQRSGANGSWLSLGRFTVDDGATAGVAIGARPGGQLRLRLDTDALDNPDQVTIEVGWRAFELVFAANGEAPYRLLFGRRGDRNHAVSADQLGSGRGAQATSTPGRAQLGEVSEAGGVALIASEGSGRPELLWLGFTLAGLMLGLLLWKIARFNRDRASPS